MKARAPLDQAFMGALRAGLGGGRVALGQQELTNALTAAVERAGACGRTCYVGGRLGNGDVSLMAPVYEVWHNGTSTDTSHQVIYAAGRLAMSQDALAHLLAVWIRRLHDGRQTDLNGPLG